MVVPRRHLEVLGETVAKMAKDEGVSSEHSRLVLQSIKLHEHTVTSGEIKAILEKVKARQHESDFHHIEIGTIVRDALTHSRSQKDQTRW
jgi:hypothetical protein